MLIACGLTVTVLYFLQMGRAIAGTGKVCGHRGRVTDIKWNPFNDNVIASGSDDATVRLLLHPCSRYISMMGWWWYVFMSKNLRLHK